MTEKPSRLYEHVGHRIRTLRESRGLSQRTLGQALSVPTNTVSRWETATYKPSIEMLYKLARYFESSIVTFLPTRLLPDVVAAAANLDGEQLRLLSDFAGFLAARRRRRPVGAARVG